MGQGTFEHLPGELVDLSESPPDSLVNYIKQQCEGIKLVHDFAAADLNREIPTLMGSGTVETINLPQHFDAIVLHKSGSSPSRLYNHI